MGIRRRARIAGLALAACVAASGCGNAAPGQTRTTVIGFTEHDFHIAGPERVPAGLVTVRVHNAGPDTHELIVVRSAADTLPLRADGLTVDEERLQRVTPGKVEAVPPGHNGETRLRLRPGHYLLFCNMAGHFRGGMHRELVVG
jgi:uncharacterized cupredoxin-like copper-binding protein